ncbi:carboxymuconolactone decarboxylase family protein [Novosphingobium mangrovi (ex Huang et al. 2023)]|uniref:Carboxymuconolactone decarboxylase family protein n=1 Tax=Novosphingobium mangrovi (ex Huang et al. 2023) TaxID=2976432 RepID=A0ABT2I603_9SPHN|nr:carboxymuconolactone decarboxylase family protein [Novosphingobium mangrovi (ex Huang et al. 2023)]MCT2400246.1 carboxymuconolactone decarboxylase family protein [Novosphingobium mangrovi (ex Huang et al. 2023)]
MGEPTTGKYDFDADARMAQAVENGPRYAPLRLDEVTPEGQEQVDAIRTAFNIPDDRPFPEVSLITLRHPGMFRAQMVLGIELAAKGTIPARERELAILRLALLARAPFEWCEHVDIGKAFGITPEEIERVIEGSSAPGWTEHEAALLRAVEELIADHCMSDATWDTLAQTYDEKQMLEMPMLVGSYLMTALQQNTLKIQPKAGFDYR